MDRSLNFGALGGAVSIVIVWIISLSGIAVPPEVSSAFTVISTVLVTALVPNKPAPPSP